MLMYLDINSEKDLQEMLDMQGMSIMDLNDETVETAKVIAPDRVNSIMEHELDSGLTNMRHSCTQPIEVMVEHTDDDGNKHEEPEVRSIECDRNSCCGCEEFEALAQMQLEIGKHQKFDICRMCKEYNKSCFGLNNYHLSNKPDIPEFRIIDLAFSIEELLEENIITMPVFSMLRNEGIETVTSVIFNDIKGKLPHNTVVSVHNYAVSIIFEKTGIKLDKLQEATITHAASSKNYNFKKIRNGIIGILYISERRIRFLVNQRYITITMKSPSKQFLNILESKLQEFTDDEDYKLPSRIISM